MFTGDKMAVKKINKSCSLTEEIIDKVVNFNQRTGTSFSEIVEKSLELYFEAIEKGNDKIVETLGTEEEEDSILVPISLYIKINDIVPVQLYNLEKQKKIQIRTFTEANNGKSKSKFVVVTEKNPEFYKAKMAMFELGFKSLENQVQKLSEEIRLMKN
jgi:hypothetical protein